MTKIKHEDCILNGDGQHLLKDLPELKDKTLGCRCSPLPCHEDVLAEPANRL